MWISKDYWPKVAVAVSDQDDWTYLQDTSVDLIELRLDLFQSHEIYDIREKISRAQRFQKPLLLTFRNDPAEGAQQIYGGDMKAEVLMAAMDLGDAVDIEFVDENRDDIIECARRMNKKVIISQHHFDQTPDTHSLEDFLLKAKAVGADIVKIAAYLKDQRDWQTFTSFTMNHIGQPLVTLGLGPWGPLTRLQYPTLGTLFTYSFIGQPKAPGQISIDEIKHHFNAHYPGYREHKLRI